jgi:hypothetical protein
MPASPLNLYCEQGATLRETVALKNPDGTIPNLTGCTTQMMYNRAAYALEKHTILDRKASTVRSWHEDRPERP